MNLKHLNLDLYGIPENEGMQMAVFLITSDIKSRKLINGLTAIGCDTCFGKCFICIYRMKNSGVQLDFDDFMIDLYFLHELLDVVEDQGGRALNAVSTDTDSQQ